MVNQGANSGNELKFVCQSMTMEEYHANKALSKSALWKIYRRERDYWWEYIQGRKKPQTNRMRFGTLLHTYLLEPHEFEKRVVTNPYPNFRSKESREWREKIESEGGIVVTENDIEVCNLLGELIEHDEYAKSLFSQPNKRFEHSFFWEQDGINLKCRPDMLIEFDDFFVAVDVKSTENAEPSKWSVTSKNLGYPMSIPITKTGVETVLDKPVKDYLFLVFETKPPYDLVLIKPEPEDEEIGYNSFQIALDKYQHCMKTGYWPGWNGGQKYVKGILPNYAYKEMQL